ncbi:MAG TPA: hypothetical protein VHP59_01615, partial [Vineibacter terrae]|nr:hypothetical protein [Vineibacter terrae]
PHLEERGLRLFAAGEARAAGRGGIAAVSLATGIARSTIGRGLRDLDSDALAWPSERVRRSGGGRKAAVVKQIRPARSAQRVDCVGNPRRSADGLVAGEPQSAASGGGIW